MNSDSLDVARAVAKEYAQHTNEKIELYVNHTAESIDNMSESIREMSRTMIESNKQIVRYEERQAHTVARMERIETGMKEQGKTQRTFEDNIKAEIVTIRDEVKKNSSVRKTILYCAGAVFVAMLSGGMLFGSITGKNMQTYPTGNNNGNNSNNVQKATN